jgi:hypothetical protein
MNSDASVISESALSRKLIVSLSAVDPKVPGAQVAPGE